MDESRWRALRELFEAARQLAPDQRPAFVAEACAGDTGLEAEVFSLLARDENATDAIGRAVGAAIVEAARPASAGLAPGRKLGRYEIVARLGAGGMGEVWLARDAELDRRVALKVVGGWLRSDSELLSRFKREARTLAALKHPNIVTIHSVEKEEGVLFLVMEHVEGATLAELIPEEGFPVQRLLELALALTRALSAAHERGIVHRDLKPGNVMVGASGELQVLDFGLAKARSHSEGSASPPLTETMTLPGTPLGTVPYMSPEQIEGKPVDPRSDVFSLGIVLYEMATGRRPFVGESPHGLISSILKDAPPSADDVRAHVPRALGAVIDRCLHKDPSRRYADAGELRRALESAGERRRSSGPGAVALGVLLAVVALLGGLVALWPREGSTSGSPSSAIDSLAVLPLLDLSVDTEQDYLADGMTEMLIAELSKVQALRVISRTSAMRFKGTDRSLPEIARALDVDGIVEGSVTRLGERVRVTVNLVDADDDRPIWGESYERSVGDLFSLQREVARAIATEIKVTLTDDEDRLLEPAGPISPQASEEYLRARHLVPLFQPEALQRAVEYSQRVIELEPDFAPAWATLAGAWELLGIIQLSAHEAYPKAKEAARRALELDPDLSLAHEALGYVALNYDRDWAEGERRFRRAVTLQGSASAHSGLSLALLVMGELDRAVVHSHRALELDPLSPLVGATHCEVLYLSRRLEEALAQCERTLELYPRHPMVVYHLVRIQHARGAHEAAARIQLEELRNRWGRSESVQRLDEAFERGGLESYNEQLIRNTLEWVEQGAEMEIDVAIYQMRAGRLDEALLWLERSLADPDEQHPFLGLDPVWDPLRGDPRFETILDRLDLPYRVTVPGEVRSGHRRSVVGEGHGHYRIEMALEA